MTLDPKKSVVYVFSVASPWSFLGHRAFIEMSAQWGLHVHYCPCNMGALFEAMGTKPLKERHESRIRYRELELKRWREKRDIPLNIYPQHAPFQAKFADYAILQAQMLGQPLEPLTERLMTAAWCENKNINDPNVVADIVSSCRDLSAQEMKMPLDEYAQVYQKNTQWALENHVFGLPTYVFQGELFWGQDRLDQLENMVLSKRCPYEAEGFPK